jgi:hypothetical protein
MKKPLVGPMSCFIGALSGVVVGTLIRLRALPFLREETILASGSRIPTAEWAAFASQLFYVASAGLVAIGLIALFTFSEANRRYVAQLPPWKRFLIWPG